jgi:L-ribulose-5-phosphate 4-epimerase
VSTTVSKELRREVLEANLRIPLAGLATLTWGNVSGVDRQAGVFVIKPSGVSYDALREEDLVVVSLSDGEVVAGRLRPSTDTETHRSLYLAFPSIGGVTHTHSTHAVAFAQARRPVPVLGTTHADTFNGPIPVTEALTPQQCAKDYEYNTGQVIVDLLRRDDARASEVPGALVAHHGPFTWGPDATTSLENAIICEAVAEMALHTIALGAAEPPQHLLDRHFTRKHGPDAYYGNPGAA